MRIAVVLNGEACSPARLRAVAASARVFAADGGARACRAAGVRPERVVGDFDSLEVGGLPGDWVCVEDADQNFTDFEKVLRRLPAGMTSLTVLGGLGGRLDHAWNNRVAAAGLPAALPVCFAGERETLWRITPACPFAGELEAGGLVSLLPMGAVEGVTASGLRWGLSEASLGPGLGIAQSNRVEGPVRVSVRSGVLYLWTDGV